VRATPCRHACVAVQEKFCVSGNMAHALRALGGPVVSVWRGRGSVHGGSKAWVSRGIESWGEGEASGEVIARGGVGGVMTTHGVLGGHGDTQGAGGVACICHCGVGSCRVVCRGDTCSLGVDKGWWH
jgi:hypothetical protein